MGLAEPGVKLTIVDKLKLGDDVQTDVRELILEHLQEHGQQVCNGPGRLVSTTNEIICSGATYSSFPRIGARPEI
jgi:hypothetical protein